MRFLRTTSTARLSALLLGVVALAAATAAIALAATRGSVQKPPPKPLARAVHDALAAPEVAGVMARIKFVNHLIDSSAVTGANPLLSGASGRLWASSGGRIRIELQSADGDVQVLSNGKSFLVYDGSSNTAYRGELPRRRQSRSEPKTDRSPSVAQIQKAVDEARTHAGSISGAIPSAVAGRPAYEVRLSPRHGGLIAGARMAWDAIRGVPLKAAIYARGDSSPVLELTATSISFGSVPASRFAVSPPRGAKVVDLTARSWTPSGRRAAGLRAVRHALPFKLSAPPRLGGRPRHEVKLIGSGALVSYGRGLDGLAVIETKADAQTQAAPLQGSERGLRLPTVSIGGTTGQELPTALGTVVRFSRGDVEYTVLGSLPADVVIAAARAL